MTAKREMLLESLRAEVWAIREDALAALLRRADSEDDEPETGAKAAWYGRWSPRIENSVGIIPIFGVLGFRRTSGWWYDGYMETLAENIDEFSNAGNVSSILLDIDSPGGTVSGIKELSAALNDAKQKKQITAVANAEAASAAYWIGSQATEFVATESAEVGSIGVWSAHLDISNAMEQRGMKITLVSAGRYKVEGNPWEELGEEARAEMQRGVDVAYDDFLTAVANGRKTSRQVVRDTFGQGRMIEANRAVSLGMIDRIATFQNVLAEKQQAVPRQRLRRAAAKIDLTESQIRR